MSNVKRIAALAIVSASTTAALFGACADTDLDHLPPQNPQGTLPDAGPGTVPDGGGSAACDVTTLNLTQTVVDVNGNPVTGKPFANRNAVYLSVTRTDANQQVIAQGFAFQVTDANGKVVSTDNAACRTFQTDVNGNITVNDQSTGSDTSCTHKLVTTADGRTLIQLSPFDKVPSGADPTRMTFVVQTLPACAGTAFPSANVLSTTFDVACITGTGSGSGSGSGSD
jgi:hypothetical protein